MVGVVGRAPGAVTLLVAKDSTRATPHAFVVASTVADATVSTDEWPAYDHLPRTGRTHGTVRQRRDDREWARDGDGDGVREVRGHTLEGFWTGLRNFLRPFRGIRTWYLGGDVAFDAGLRNYTAPPALFLRVLLGPSGPFTENGS